LKKNTNAKESATQREQDATVQVIVKQLEVAARIISKPAKASFIKCDRSTNFLSLIFCNETNAP